MKKAIKEIVRIFIVMFVSAMLISITWQISSAANKYDHLTLDSKYSDLGFNEVEKKIFIKEFTQSSLNTMIITIGKLKNCKLSIQILKDDQYWSDLRIMFNELAIKFTESDNMTFSELFNKVFYQGIQHAVKFKRRLELSAKK